ncbi:hypothetical protein [Alkalicoccobacillus gibsonii]|uniref:hypothetical protein n=1 Tax=Alkalicoccobacillus gibsonii TaxID=79881 RepID=UPI003516E452
MPRATTTYSVLLSCPSDVNEEQSIIKECIEQFNEQFGEHHSINLKYKHWSKDSYPKQGDRPQAILNEQIVHDSDLAVAIFWTKFGSPTGEFDSSTEEEIDILVNSDKQVFLYFSKKPITPDDIDGEQYQKVKDYKDRNSGKGIYSEFSSTEDLRKIFYIHLTKYFMREVFEVDRVIENKKPKNKLSIKGIENNKFQSKPNIFSLPAKKLFDLNRYKDEIYPIVQKINEFDEEFNYESYEGEKENNLPNNLGLSFLQGKKVQISESTYTEIKKFAETEEIDLNDSFFDLGNLKLTPDPLPGNGSGYSYRGEKGLKTKYFDILEINSLIKKDAVLPSLVSSMSEYYYTSLVLSNEESDYDEEIDVKLIIPEKFNHIEFITASNFVKPRAPIIGDMKELANIFIPEKTHKADEYSDRYYGIAPPIGIPQVGLYPQQPSKSEIIEEETREFVSNLEETFDYEVYENNRVIRFMQKSIKSNYATLFPSMVVLSGEIEEIDYEIRSKNSSGISKGTISFITED